MGLLEDFSVYVDGLKRKGMNTAREFVNSPTGLLSQNVAQFSESLPATPQSVMPGVDQSGMGPARPSLMDWGMGAAVNNNPVSGLLGHTVYHGSPHKFDKFDASKIGTGEGAQAYGHGVYLAESPNTAGFYQANLAPRGHLPPNPKQFKNLETGEAYAQSEGKFFKGDGKEIAKTEYGEAFRAAQKAWENPAMAGNLYKADLPDEWLPKMLDWDKPLSQQPEAVRKALQKVNPKNRSGQKLLDMDPSGEELVRATGGGHVLAEHGIPGIRYKDQGSRGSEGGTHNYVVFPGMEDKLKILERK